MSDLTELPPLNATRFSAPAIVAETGSTNADLLEAARRGEREGSVLVTDHQTAGRGRQRRAWHDDPGTSLLVSFLVRPDREIAPLTPLLAGVAAVEATAMLAAELGWVGDGEPAGLKWPNDVLAPSAGERKLAGILAESISVGDGDRELAVVVGMGFNLRWLRDPPDEIAARAATLEAVLGRSVARDALLDRYLRHVDRWLGRMEADGPEVLLDRYRQVCLTLGRRVRFATATAEYEGDALDVTAEGHLLLSTATDGVVELRAGDAHHVA